MRNALSFTGISTVVAVAVALFGISVVSASARGGVWAGAMVALACQTLLFWLFFVGIFRNQRLLAHLLGMFGRFFAFGVAALVWVPRAGLPAAPTLFSLVTVFFVTTLVESVFVQSKNL